MCEVSLVLLHWSYLFCGYAKDVMCDLGLDKFLFFSLKSMFSGSVLSEGLILVFY